MESEAYYEQLMIPEESSPIDNHPKLKRLKKEKESMEKSDNPPDLSDGYEPKAFESDEQLLQSEDEERESELDGLDPLFWEADHTGAKRVLEFDENGDGFSGDDVDNDLGNSGDKKKKNKKRPTSEEFGDKEDKNKKKKRNRKSDGKPKLSKRKEKEEKKANLAQLADFQRVMRERKGVGFKPVPIVQKPISSLLEKIRQRKMEVSKKVMAPSSIVRSDSTVQIPLDDDPQDANIIEKSECKIEKSVPGKPMTERPAANANPNSSPVNAISEDKPCSSDEQTSSQEPLEQETKQSFRAPVNDTQDLFSDSQTSDTQDDRSNEDLGTLAEEDVAPSLRSLNLKFDSALPDDISSDEEESDKENINPLRQPLFKGNSSQKGDPIKEFVDEEALEDDSDNDLMHFQDEDEEDNADIDEIRDYIATDCKEKSIDGERRNQLHQMWLQQQDEAGTENLLQRLKYGVKQREPTLLKDEDDDAGEEDESDNEDTEDPIPTLGARMSTKKLKQMIPLMFTDKDDGFVSSEDEETERRLSKQRLLQKVELEEQSKFSSPAEDETSREVFGRIKKLNILPEAKKKAQPSSLFDTLLSKGGNNNSSKSSFLRRASSHTMTSSHKRGPSTVRSFIFGRDDSSSRSSIQLSEDSQDLSQKESQSKRNASAKFSRSQAKWNTQHREIRGETVSGTSLFEILKCSSLQTGHDIQDSMVDHQAVFAAFKSEKKTLKVEGRS